MKQLFFYITILGLLDAMQEIFETKMYVRVTNFGKPHIKSSKLTPEKYEILLLKFPN